MSEPIDREALKREADSVDGDRAVVSRAWLKRVHEELTLLDQMRIVTRSVFGPDK